MLILYFSATGNSLYVSKQIGENLYSIPKAIKEDKLFFSDEKIGLIFPVYELGVPKYIKDFLEKVELRSDYIFSIMTYGMFSGSASSQLQSIGNKNKIKFSYINEVVMVDNYIPVYHMEEQIAKKDKKEIDKQILKIKEDISSNKIYIKKNNHIVKLLTHIAVKFRFPKRDKELGVYQQSFDKSFQVENHCVGCGICGKVCPINNIDLINKRPSFKGNCIGCLSCTHNCPQNSIRVNKEKSKVRFRNEHISLKEIISSNN